MILLSLSLADDCSSDFHLRSNNPSGFSNVIYIAVYELVGPTHDMKNKSNRLQQRINASSPFPLETSNYSREKTSSNVAVVTCSHKSPRAPHPPSPLSPRKPDPTPSQHSHDTDQSHPADNKPSTNHSGSPHPWEPHTSDSW
jgi:hypothetical protein